MKCKTLNVHHNKPQSRATGYATGGYILPSALIENGGVNPDDWNHDAVKFPFWNTPQRTAITKAEVERVAAAVLNSRTPYIFDHDYAGDDFSYNLRFVVDVAAPELIKPHFKIIKSAHLILGDVFLFNLSNRRTGIFKVTKISFGLIAGEALSICRYGENKFINPFAPQGSAYIPRFKVVISEHEMITFMDSSEHDRWSADNVGHI